MNVCRIGGLALANIALLATSIFDRKPYLAEQECDKEVLRKESKRAYEALAVDKLAYLAEEQRRGRVKRPSYREAYQRLRASGLGRKAARRCLRMY